MASSVYQQHKRVLTTTHMDILRLLNPEDCVLDHLVHVHLIDKRSAKKIRSCDDRDDQIRELEDRLPQMGNKFLIEFVRGLHLCANGSPNRELAKCIEDKLTAEEREEIKRVPVQFHFEADDGTVSGGSVEFQAPASCTAFNQSNTFIMKATEDEQGRFSVPNEGSVPTLVGTYRNSSIFHPGQQKRVRLQMFSVGYDTRHLRLEASGGPDHAQGL